MAFVSSNWLLANIFFYIFLHIDTTYDNYSFVYDTHFPKKSRIHYLGIILSFPFHLQIASETDFEDVEQKEEHWTRSLYSGSRRKVTLFIWNVGIKPHNLCLLLGLLENHIWLWGGKSWLCNCFENHQSPSKANSRDRELGREPGGLLLDLRPSSKGLRNHGHRRSHGWRSHWCRFAALKMAQLGLWAGSLGRRKGTWEIGPWKRCLKFLLRNISEDVLSWLLGVIVAKAEGYGTGWITGRWVVIWEGS